MEADPLQTQSQHQPAPEPQQGAEQGAELLATLRRLWPEAEVRVEPDPSTRPGRGRGRRTTPGADRLALALGPGASRSRLLVALDPAPAAARTLTRFSAASTPRDVVSRLLGGGAVRAGVDRWVGDRLLGDRLVVSGLGGDSLAAHLAEVLGCAVTFSLGIGTDRVNRKPVLQVFDARGRTVAFVKIGDSALSRADVAAEAEHLSRVSARTWRHLEVPRVLDLSVWQGLLVLVLSPLATGPWQRPRDTRRPPRAASAELAAGFEPGALPLEELAWLAGLRRQVAGLEDGQVRDRLLACAERLVDLSGGRPWATGVWHGDWTPWNMARTHPGPGARVRVWDWERFEVGVPIGLDVVHYVVNAHTYRAGTTPATLAAAVGLAIAEAESDTEHRRADEGPAAHVVATYLWAISVRYLRLAESERGAAILGRGRMMLATLEDLLVDLAAVSRGAAPACPGGPG